VDLSRAVITGIRSRPAQVENYAVASGYGDVLRGTQWHGTKGIEAAQKTDSVPNTAGGRNRIENDGDLTANIFWESDANGSVRRPLRRGRAEVSEKS
jgi:hypothetical protein